MVIYSHLFNAPCRHLAGVNALNARQQLTVLLPTQRQSPVWLTAQSCHEQWWIHAFWGHVWGQTHKHSHKPPKQLPLIAVREDTDTINITCALNAIKSQSICSMKEIVLFCISQFDHLTPTNTNIKARCCSKTVLDLGINTTEIQPSVL